MGEISSPKDEKPIQVIMFAGKAYVSSLTIAKELQMTARNVNIYLSKQIAKSRALAFPIAIGRNNPWITHEPIDELFTLAFNMKRVAIAKEYRSWLHNTIVGDK